MTTRHFHTEPADRRRIVKNQSSRNGAPIQAIALHSTEGGTLDSVHQMFDDPKTEASSHVGVGRDGTSERWVPDTRKAWTILDLNSVTLNIEMIGFASQQKVDWTEKQINEVARWIAYWSIKHGIPIRRGWVRNVAGRAVILRKGVIRHSQLTDAGFGTHTDPGRNFPMTAVLRKAKWYKKNGWTV